MVMNLTNANLQVQKETICDNII